MALALLYAVTAIRYRADQVVVGIAINLLVIGATRFFLRLAFHSSANSPRVPGFGAEQSGTGVGALVENPLIWLGVLAVAGRAWLLYRTPFGLRVRAVGEHPAAAVSVGVPVDRVRYIAAALSGALAALGRRVSRARPASVQRRDDGGTRLHRARGDRSSAAGIPLRAALACLLFAAAETLQIQLQGSQVIPSQFVEMIPYALTIIALAGVVGRAVPPAALGRVAE